MFFSDGVFAIAITLLVIDLHPPDLARGLGDAAFADALLAQLPRVFAYLLSFAVIGLYWLAHWRRFHDIVRSDQVLAGLNLLLLGTISFIPFPTALMGEQGHRPLTAAIYATTVSLAGLLGTATWLYARRAGLTRSDLTPGDSTFAAVRGLGVPVVMLGSLALLPVVGAYGAELSWSLIFVFQVVVSRRFGRRRGASG